MIYHCHQSLIPVPMIYAHKIPGLKADPPSPGFPNGTPKIGFNLFEYEGAEAELLYCHVSDSYVAPFIDELDRFIGHSSGINSTDSTNVTASMACGMRIFTIGTSGTAYGLVCGSGTAALTSVNTYKMGAAYAHGTGANQLYLDHTTCAKLVNTGSQQSFGIARSFWNVSGGVIPITEMGLIHFDGTAKYFLMCRDLLSVTVNNGEMVVLTYLFNFTT